MSDKNFTLGAEAFPLAGMFSFQSRGPFKILPGYLLTKLAKICQIIHAGLCLHFYISFRYFFFNFNFVLYIFFHYAGHILERLGHFIAGATLLVFRTATNSHKRITTWPSLKMN